MKKKLKIALSIFLVSLIFCGNLFAAGISISIDLGSEINIELGTIDWNDNGGIINNATIIDAYPSYFVLDISSTYEAPIIAFDMYLKDPFGVLDGYNFIGINNPPIIPFHWSLESGDERTNYEGDFDLGFQSPDGPISLDLHNWGSGPDFAVSIISTEFIGYLPTNLLFAGYTITEGYFSRSVPTPAGLWLLGSGLIGLFVFRRKFYKG